MSNRNNFPMIVIVVAIFVLAFFERTFFDLGPNLELVTLATLAAGFYLSGKSGLQLTLALLILSDVIIGNTRIFLFTWSGFIIPLLLFPRLKSTFPRLPTAIAATTLGISANLFFFLWTNFGVWALDSWGMYPDTLAGLLQSYIAGLPFLKLHLISTLLFVPLGFLAISLAQKFLVRHYLLTGKRLI